jgi:predicted RNase H-like HicB family nuclease
MLTIEVEREDDGRWIAEIADLPGVLAYGHSREEAVERAKAVSLRVMADRLEHGESVPEMGGVFAVVP